MVFNGIQAQIKMLVSAKTGYAFNASIEINNEIINNSRALDFEIETALKVYFLKNIFTEGGIAGRLILATGTVNNNNFNSQTTRILSPIRLGIRITKKWDASIGVTFQNNVDLTGINSKINFFWKKNYTLKGNYQYKNKWSFLGELSYSANNIPDVFLVNDPKIVIFFGITRIL